MSSSKSSSSSSSYGSGTLGAALAATTGPLVCWAGLAGGAWGFCWGEATLATAAAGLVWAGATNFFCWISSDSSSESS